jgi:hypothetical protein
MHDDLVSRYLNVDELPGNYDIEFDIVWEGVMWMKDRGNPTARVELPAKTS